MSSAVESQLQRIGAYAVCVSDADEILLSRYTSGRWTLPGGGVEHGEHPEASVVREVAEETGYSSRVVRLLGVQSGSWTTPDMVSVHSVNVLYVVEITGGELQYEIDGTSDRAVWLPITELPNYDHTEIVDHAVAQALPRPT